MRFYGLEKYNEFCITTNTVRNFMRTSSGPSHTAYNSATLDYSLTRQRDAKRAWKKKSSSHSRVARVTLIFKKNAASGESVSYETKCQYGNDG